jgi:hypothetical protein
LASWSIPGENDEKFAVLDRSENNLAARRRSKADTARANLPKLGLTPASALSPDGLERKLSFALYSQVV